MITDYPCVCACPPLTALGWLNREKPTDGGISHRVLRKEGEEEKVVSPIDHDRMYLESVAGVQLALGYLVDDEQGRLMSYLKEKFKINKMLLACPETSWLALASHLTKKLGNGTFISATSLCSRVRLRVRQKFSPFSLPVTGSGVHLGHTGDLSGREPSLLLEL